MRKKIILDSRIYPVKIVKRGIQDYQQVSEIQITNVAHEKIYCEFKCLDEDFKMIRNEYCNYLIALKNIMER